MSVAEGIEDIPILEDSFDASRNILKRSVMQEIPSHDRVIGDFEFFCETCQDSEEYPIPLFVDSWSRTR
jgi:hypothetical protein